MNGPGVLIGLVGTVVSLVWAFICLAEGNRAAWWTALGAALFAYGFAGVNLQAFAGVLP